jgi:hypothetical protein
MQIRSSQPSVKSGQIYHNYALRFDDAVFSVSPLPGSKMSCRLSSKKCSHVRQPLDRRCWIDVGGDNLMECSLGDTMQSGARLLVSVAAEIPDEFELYFTEDRTVARKCRVVWRSDSQAGIAFTLPTAAATAGRGRRSNGVKVMATKRNQRW